MWITEYREEHGLSLEALGKAMRRAGAKLEPPVKVSDILLERLELEPKFRTVPRIADLIADVCGATAEQRDELVLEQYKGTWKPSKRVKSLEFRVERKKTGGTEEDQDKPSRAENSRRPVVAVDRAGFALFRFASVHNAAARCGVTHKAVYPRCMRRLGRDEFALLGFTFRYADEWDAMTDAQRRADVQGTSSVSAGALTPVHGPAGPISRESVHRADSRALDAPTGEGLGEATEGTSSTLPPVPTRINRHYQRRVVAADGAGLEAGRWDSVSAATEATGVARSMISMSITGKRKGSPFIRGTGLAFVAAEKWDGMTVAQRREMLGINEI